MKFLNGGQSNTFPKKFTTCYGVATAGVTTDSYGSSPYIKGLTTTGFKTFAINGGDLCNGYVLSVGIS